MIALGWWHHLRPHACSSVLLDDDDDDWQMRTRCGLFTAAHSSHTLGNTHAPHRPRSACARTRPRGRWRGFSQNHTQHTQHPRAHPRARRRMRPFVSNALPRRHLPADPPQTQFASGRGRNPSQACALPPETSPPGGWGLFPATAVAALPQSTVRILMPSCCTVRAAARPCGRAARPLGGFAGRAILRSIKAFPPFALRLSALTLQRVVCLPVCACAWAPALCTPPRGAGEVPPHCHTVTCLVLPASTSAARGRGSWAPLEAPSPSHHQGWRGCACPRARAPLCGPPRVARVRPGPLPGPARPHLITANCWV